MMNGSLNRPFTSYSNVSVLSTCGTGTSAGTFRRSIVVTLPAKRYGNGVSMPIDPLRVVTPAPYASPRASSMSTAFSVIVPRACSRSAA